MTYLNHNLSQDHLDKTYQSDYYWYLKSPEFSQTFLKPLGNICNELGGHVLDVGCGEGQLYRHINVEYTGIDASSIAIERAKETWPGDFRVARFETWEEQGFDTVVFGGVLSVIVLPTMYISFIRKFGGSHFIIYDLQKLDTTDIDKRWECIHSIEAKADLPIGKVKCCRKIRVYRCE